MRGGVTTQLPNVLDLIYEAPLAEGAWRPALTAVADFVGSESVDLNFLEPKFLVYRRLEYARIDADTIQRYSAGFMSDTRNLHPRAPTVARLRDGQMFADSELWSTAERGRHPYFADVFYRAGWRDAITACVCAGGDGADLVVLGAYFPRTIHASLLPEHRQRIAVVLPHLRRACAVEARLLQARRETATLTDALNRVTDAVAMLDRDGRVVFANPGAAATFRAENGISLAPDERLLLSTSEARAGLAQALSRCAGSLFWTPDHDTGPPVSVAVRWRDGQPLILTLQPLPKDLAGAFGAVALLFICDPGSQKADHSGLLREVYGLTTAEAQLAQAVGDGVALKQYADARQITYETARTFLRRIFDKTGVRRQSELASVVRALR
ncbi:helix-turn-helix transcriptional regulator [Polaromonas sp.]|uniref:helix-turn-helix transcriptional regulator n=1 Tax=Polaromonas sp. TaxID=1869339 RepID=UPI002FCA31CB